MNDSLSWEDAQTFLTVSEQGSFSAAARILNLKQPTISRRIQRIEQRIQAQLFVRGKQGAIPTDAAKRLLPIAEQMARWAAEFERAAHGAEQRAEGKVTIAAPPGIAVEQLAPFAVQLKRLQPAINLELLAAIEHVDLTRGHADIAIRTKPPNQPELEAVLNGSSSLGVFATPGYIAQLSKKPELQDLDWICWGGQYRNLPPRPILEQLIDNFEPVFTADDYLVQKAAAEAGLGAIIMGKPQAFESTELVEIPMNLDLPTQEFFVVCAKSMRQVPRVRVVLDALTHALQSNNF